MTNVQKQKEELKRIHSMLDDLENDFMGSKENNTFIERYMEVSSRFNLDYGYTFLEFFLINNSIQKLRILNNLPDFGSHANDTVVIY